MKRLLVAVLLLVTTDVMAADTLGKTAVKTLAATDLQAQPVGADGSTKLNVQAVNTAIGSGGGAQVLSGLVNSTLPTHTAGNIAMPSIDLAGRTYVTTDSASTLRTNIVQIGGSTQSATNPLFTQLTDGSTAYVGTKTGQLPTALGQTTKSGSISVALASDQGTLATSVGAPTGATTVRATAQAITSGSTTTVTCKSSLTTSTPVKLYQAHITSMSPMRCTLRYNDNGSFTNYGDVMVAPANPMATFACPAGFCATTSGASGTQALEASCTNLDSVTNDVVCDVQYCQSASGC